MKRVLCTVIAMLLLAGSAFAEVDLDQELREYNIRASIFGAPELDASEALTGSTDAFAYFARFQLTDMTITLSSKTGDAFDGAMCSCSNEACIGDFLAYCTAVYLYLFGTSGITDMMGSLMYDYLECRGGRSDELLPSIVPDEGYYKLELEDGIYKFIVVMI